MPSRSETGAKVAGILVAVASLGFVIYRPLAPLLTGYDPLDIAGAAGIIALVIITPIVLVTRRRRRQLASRIRRR